MRRKVILALCALASLGVSACGSESNADKVNKNLGTAAEQFEVQRTIVGINGITGKAEFEVTGRCSLEQNGSLPRNLEVICKHGPDDFRKHFIGLSDNTFWIASQPNGIDVSEYRTRIILKPENLVPDFDLVTGESP